MYSNFYAFLQTPRVSRIIWIVIPMMYLAGVLGLQSEATEKFFRLLVPFHLLVTLVVLLLYHEDWNASTIFFCVTTYLIGLSVEFVGVHTGLVFGQYMYGSTLGIKILGIPIIIGANWLVLIYSVGVWTAPWAMPTWAKATVGALVIAGIDVLIEPVAMRFDFWGWSGSIVPLQNYLAWFVVSWGLLYLFFSLPFRKYNPLARLLLACQVLFFVAHNLLLIAKK